MKKSLIFCLFFACASVADAQFLAGRGIANDYATGKNPSDVQFVARGNGNPYGYRSYDMAIGGTILPWAIPNCESSVTGVRINLGWGFYERTTGFDTGTFSYSGDASGLQINLLGNAATRDAIGIQIGLVNVVKKNDYGLQIGLINYADHLSGMQIGLLNFAKSQWTLPILNIAF